MAEKATVARPYARAAFGHARDTHALAAWSGFLAAGAAVAASPGAADLFTNPRVKASELIEFVAGVATDSGSPVDAHGRNFLALLAHNRRLAFLPEIAAQFEALRADVENTLDVEVTTAFALTPEQREHLSQSLATRFRRQIRIAETVDATLVGGAIISAGDLVIDGSVQGRLARLQQQISQP